jgi:hypothetical protein
MEQFTAYYLDESKVKWLKKNIHLLNDKENAMVRDGREWSWRVSTIAQHKYYQTMLLKTDWEDNSIEINVAQHLQKQIDELMQEREQNRKIISKLAEVIVKINNKIDSPNK